MRRVEIVGLSLPVLRGKNDATNSVQPTSRVPQDRYGCAFLVVASISQWSSDKLHKNTGNLCELSNMCELTIHRSQWESIQLCH